MKKASLIKDFDQLLMSDYNVDLLRRKADTLLPVSNLETEPLAKLILWGRQILPDIKETTSKYILEFLKTLDELELIRHDFKPISLNLGRFYQDVFFGETTPYLVYFLSDFKTNRAYETYRNASWGDCVAVIGAIESIVEDNDMTQLVANYYGLKDGYSYYLKDIGQDIKMKAGRTYAQFRKAMEKIRDNKDSLPQLFNVEKRIPAVINPGKRPYYMYSFMENKRNHDKTGRKGLDILAAL